MMKTKIINPTLINPHHLLYRAFDPSSGIVAKIVSVYENTGSGKVAFKLLGDVSNLRDEFLPHMPGGNYRTCNATGEFQLATPPFGEIYCEIDVLSENFLMRTRRVTDPALLDCYLAMVEKGHITRNELRCLIGFPPL